MPYQVLDLGPSRYPWRLSNSNVAVGWSWNAFAGGGNSGVIWNPNAALVHFPAALATKLWGVNEAGHSCGRRGDLIVGTYDWPASGANRHGFVRLADGTFFDLGPIVGEGLFSTLEDINNKGIAVGSKGEYASPSLIKFDTQNPTAVIDMGGPDGWQAVHGQGINDKGEIAGVGSKHGEMRFFAHYDEVFHDLGPAGKTMMGKPNLWMSVRITESGRIPAAVPLGVNDSEAAFFDLHGNGQWQKLGLLSGATSSVARDANDRGEVVGFCPQGNDDGRAFLWWPEGGMHDLNWHLHPDTSQGWVLQMATGINDVGHIVGLGTYYGAQHAFKLVPADQTPKFEGWATFQRILVGVIQDGGGVTWTPKGPRPVPPWGPLREEDWALLNRAQQDVIAALTLLQAASAFQDVASQREQRQVAGVALGRALERIMEGRNRG